MAEPLLLVFAKSPAPGLVKTRLMKAMSAEAAAAIYEQLLNHTLIQSSLVAAKTVVWRSGETGHPYWLAWPSVTFCEQPEGDLGYKMAFAIEHSMQENQPVVVVGSDCLALTAEYIEQAFIALALGVDVVLGPAIDGGYVLIAMKQLHQELFEGVSWSTDRVFAQTLAKIQALGLRYKCLPALNDVDTADDAIASGLFSSS